MSLANDIQDLWAVSQQIVYDAETAVKRAPRGDQNFEFSPYDRHIMTQQVFMRLATFLYDDKEAR